MTSKIKNWALWGTGLSTAALVLGASLYIDMPHGAEAAPAAAPPPAVPVTVTKVEPQQVATWQEFSGRLEAVDRVQIRARVGGTIQAVHFTEGGLVKAGDLLVTIDPDPYQAAVEQAEGHVSSAQAKLQYAETELERGKMLAARNTISQSDLSQRQSVHLDAEASLKSAKAELRAANINLGYTQIRAPISGRVGRIEVTVGNLVAASSSSAPLTTLVSIDPIYASFDASEDFVTRILAELPMKNGSPDLSQVPVEISTSENAATPLTGKLQLIDNEVNASSGTIRVRAVFDNPEGRLLPGQFVRVRMGQPKSEKRLLVSERAVGTDQDKKFVFVVDAANAVAYRPVELGDAVNGMRIVEKGLSAGDRIVVNGLQRVRPGVIVAPQEDVATK